MSEWTRDPGAAAFATSGSPTKVDAGGRHARARGMDEAYLDRQFVQGGLQESQSLEYKASAALGRRAPTGPSYVRTYRPSRTLAAAWSSTVSPSTNTIRPVSTRASIPPSSTRSG